MLRLHEALVDPVLRKFKGRRIKQIAGTFLVAFESPTQAVLCAAALQDRARRLSLDVRIGIHLGEVRLARGDVFGEPVNIAARIEASCGPGEVLFVGAGLAAMLAVAAFFALARLGALP